MRRWGNRVRAGPTKGKKRENSLARAGVRRRSHVPWRRSARVQRRRSRPGTGRRWCVGRISCAVLASGHVRELGLVLHQYHGPLDEDVTLRERRRVKVTAALPEVLRDLDEDVLYLFHA